MADLAKLKQLREETNVSYALCKKALEESGDDIQKAKEYLKQTGIDMANKKSSRETKQGAVFSYIHHNKKIGSMVEVLCETDFVAINESFQELGKDIALHIASTNPESKEALLKENFIKRPDLTIEDLIKENILKLGENIVIGNMIRYEI